MVVTGAAGLLAAPAVRLLLGAGHDVLAWIRPETDPWRLQGFLEHPRLHLLRSDLQDLLDAPGRERARSILADFAPAAVLHAAWRGIRGPSREDPAQVDNVAIGLELLRSAAAAGARRFVAIGSQAEYGPNDHPLSEDAPARPVTLYGAAKLACGQLVLTVAPRLGVSAAWIRAFSVYGPGERSRALVPDLVRALTRGESFPLSSCEQLWDYLYEEDAGEALARLSLDDSATGVFNLASGRAVPLRQAVEMVFALVAPGRRPEYGPRPSPGDRLPHLIADVTRIHKALGWEPRVSLDQGLSRTVQALLDKER